GRCRATTRRTDRDVSRHERIMRHREPYFPGGTAAACSTTQLGRSCHTRPNMVGGSPAALEDRRHDRGIVSPSLTSRPERKFEQHRDAPTSPLVQHRARPGSTYDRDAVPRSYGAGKPLPDIIPTSAGAREASKAA